MFTDPKTNIQQFGLLPGQSVADLGAGSGFYTVECAKVVGPKGQVYAVDVQKDILTRLKLLANKEHLFNIEVIWGDLEKLGGTHIRDHAVDAVIVSNVLFQMENHAAFISEILRIIKPGGRILIIDWSDEFTAGGPPAEMLCSEAKARGLFEGHGFRFEKTLYAGDSHYGLIYRAP